jgi:hypothetical protein
MRCLMTFRGFAQGSPSRAAARGLQERNATANAMRPLADAARMRYKI